MHGEVELCILTTTANRCMVDKHAVGEVAYLTLHNGIGTHGLLIQRTLYLAETTALYRTPTMLL